MGWFNDQIEYRNKRENELLTDSFQHIAQSVSGHKIGDGIFEEQSGMQDAISQLLNYFNIREKEIPEKIDDLEEQLDFLLSSSGVRFRKIQLEKGWYKDAMGVMMTSLQESGAVITLIPGNTGGYVYIDPHTGVKKKINQKEADKFKDDAFCFYRPFPMRRLKSYDLWKYMVECLTIWDVLSFCLSAIVIILIGTLMPRLNKILTGSVLAYKSKQLLIAVILYMLCVTMGTMLFTSIRQLLLTRIGTKLSVSMSAATMIRVFSLPTEFFKDYSTGELNQYLKYMDNICDTMVDSLFSTGITGVFSLVYLFQIFSYAKGLVIPSLLVTLSTLLVGLTTALIQITISKERMKLEAKEKGFVYSLISGIQKIRLSGAEKRSFKKWADLYAEEAALAYNPPAILKLNRVFTTLIGLCGTIVIYYVAVKTEVSISDYYAFNTAYAYIASAFTALVSVAATVATIRPSIELIKPLMEAEPESKEERETIKKLSGSLELSHISFRYKQEEPLIIDDLSVSIASRQYVAIVGKTGCGKSTLLRLLLGFEHPTAGSIFYDRKDTRRLDMQSVRKKIGTVTQDGKLFQGSIFDNIKIASPNLTIDEAWEAAEIAGISEDIRRMPMGMYTMISEGSGGISGGQKQRIMIARAVASKPRILIFDEATSALDNITQKHITEALDKLRCTRIIIAHRLSTIRHCDRILVLDKGKIVEDGNFEELIEKNGIFAELVERQRI